jgi:hypothetical protein
MCEPAAWRRISFVVPITLNVLIALIVAINLSLIAPLLLVSTGLGRS